MSESEQDQTPIDGDPALTTPDDDETELEASEIVTDAKGNKTVSLSTMLRYKKEAKTLSKRVKELEPVAARAEEVNGRLDRAQPLIDAIVSNPKLRAEALRIAGGTRTTADSAPLVDEADDPDAAAIAEEFGHYLADGQTPDVARGRRILARLDARHGKQTDDRIRPLAGLTMNDKANQNLREAEAMVDKDGTPLATKESIQEMAKQLPPQLLANPQVIDMVINSAIGLDRRKGRTPKPVDEPVFMERQGGGFRRQESTISPEEKKQLERLGLTEKDYAASTKRLETGVASRRGIVLGS